MQNKEMIFSFGKDPEFDVLQCGDTCIESVKSAKLLGGIISSDLKWSEYVDYIVGKARKILYYIRRLKRAGLSESELVRIFLSLIRPICEYACPVWCTSLSKELSNNIESIQTRPARNQQAGVFLRRCS